MAVPVAAEEWTAPDVTGAAGELLPTESGGFGADLWYIVRTALGKVLPSLRQCMTVCLAMVAMLLLLSVIRGFAGQAKAAAQLCAVVVLSCLLLGNTGSMMDLASQTIAALSDYIKLLLPVLAGALAAQGGSATSTALYTITAGLDALVSVAVSDLLVPMVYIFLVLAILHAAVEEETVKKLRDTVKSAMSWLLKTGLYAYIGFLSITPFFNSLTL